MLLTREELLEDKTLGARLKAWGARINTEAKKADAPIFKIKGPMTLKVRLRKTGYPSGNYSFMGDEEFRVDQLLIERDPVSMATKLALVFNPVHFKLASEIMTMVLPMSDAIDVLDGLEDWLSLDAIAVETPPESKPVVPKKPPTVEEHRAAGAWGAW